MIVGIIANQNFENGGKSGNALLLDIGSKTIQQVLQFDILEVRHSQLKYSLKFQWRNIDMYKNFPWKNEKYGSKQEKFNSLEINGLFDMSYSILERLDTVLKHTAAVNLDSEPGPIFRRGEVCKDIVQYVYISIRFAFVFRIFVCFCIYSERLYIKKYCVSRANISHSYYNAHFNITQKVMTHFVFP